MFSDHRGVFEDVRIADVLVRFRRIPAGTFTMGSPADEASRVGEGPQRQVTLTDPFWLADAPVTQALWEAVTGENPSHFKGADRPVEQVSWDDVMRFIEQINASQPELAARLPTEAQWEYACRAGTTTARYGDLDAVAWYAKNSGKETHPVRQKQANAWGLYDTLGNVWEWCADRWQSTYAPGAVTNPTGPEKGSYRVDRGGSWAVSAGVVRAACRNGGRPGIRSRYGGFRLSRGPAPSGHGAEPPRSRPDAKAGGAGQRRNGAGLLPLLKPRVSAPSGALSRRWVHLSDGYPAR